MNEVFPKTFGRILRENGNGGTDHVYEDVMMVFVGNINGGRVSGKRPELNENDLYQNRDLAVTTDSRTVLSESITKQVSIKDFSTIFAGFNYSGSNPHYR